MTRVLGNHRGFVVDRRIKAGFWWQYMYSEKPSPYARMLAELPDDGKIIARMIADEMSEALRGRRRR